MIFRKGKDAINLVGRQRNRVRAQGFKLFESHRIVVVDVCDVVIVVLVIKNIRIVQAECLEEPRASYKTFARRTFPSVHHGCERDMDVSHDCDYELTCMQEPLCVCFAVLYPTTREKVRRIKHVLYAYYVCPNVVIELIDFLKVQSHP